MTRLKFERTRRGLSQNMVSLVTGVRQPTVGLIEQGRLVPTAEQLARFEAAFGIPGDVLMQPAMPLEPRVKKAAR